MFKLSTFSKVSCFSNEISLFKLISLYNFNSLALREEKKLVDKITKGAKMHN